MSLQPHLVSGSSIGLREDVKPFLQPEQALSALENAYVYRERIIKKEGFEFIGRLRRVLLTQNLGNTDGLGVFTGNIVAILGLESTANIEPGSIEITIGAQVFVETVPIDGTLTNGGAGTGTINYATGDLVVNTNPALPATPVTIDFNYFPGLPVMGIWQRETASINDEPTIFFDTTYAYIFTGTAFVEFIPGTIWAGTDSDFFWATNYRGITADVRLFFVTNYFTPPNAANPIRYTDGATWTTFTPLVSATESIFQARIIIPYYGRLLMLDTWEGTVVGSTVNFFNRCRFSQVGNPIDVDAFRSDIFGRGGFIDAPTNERIISATFFKNTLIVFFERTTWQLRYVGEYGLPFLWERISSDFGSESTFSPVLFDDGVAAIGDRAIIKATAIGANRIDNQIPDFVFTILNGNDATQQGVKRVIGIRDFQRELVFWTYPDSISLAPTQYFPNKVLVYNYRNNTYAIFDDSITFFGTLQPSDNITWGSTDVFWGDMETLWGDVDNQSKFPRIVAGNQEGFVGYYGYVRPDQESLAIKAINTAVVPNQLTVINHNLQSNNLVNPPVGEIIKITGAVFGTTPDPGFNNNYYQVRFIDKDTISLFIWTGTTFSALDLTNGSAYLGNGVITVFPQLLINSKDFNPYIAQGNQLKLSYLDFLFDATEIESAVSVNIYANSSLAFRANLPVGNSELEVNLPSPFYVPASEYVWHRFYATVAAQFIRFSLTYNSELMCTDATHQSDFVMNAFVLWTRPGGKSIF